MILDLTTLYLVSALVTGTSGVLFLLDMRGRPDPALRWWGVAFLCAISPALIYAVAAQRAEFLVLNPLGNGFVVAGSALLWVGARSFNKRRTRLAMWLGPVALTIGLPFVLDHPLQTWSGFPLLAGWVVAFNTLAAYECLRAPAPRLRNSAVLAGAWAIGAAFYAVRLVAFLLYGPDDPRFAVPFGSEATTVAVLMLIVVSSFSMVALGKEVSERALQEAASRDGLTGALNRATFTRLAETELAQGAVNGAPLAVLLLDLDHFKRINDTHGHAVGDAVLVSVAAAMARSIGPRDLFCRYGGEEFAVLLPGASSELAHVVAERMLRAVRSIAVGTPEGLLRPTTSIGIAAGLSGATDLTTMLREADIALYRAKSAGRNRAMGAGRDDAATRAMLTA